MTKTLDLVLKDATIIRIMDDYIGKIIHSNHDYYEKELLEYFKEYMPTNGIVYDIGANIGNHTLYFSHALNPKKIYSFEPAKELFEVLEFNVQVNKLKNVEVFNCAVGKESGEKLLTYNPQNTGASNISLDGDEVVRSVTLDKLKIEKPDFVKIDVEGFEYDVIQGMQNILKVSSPVLWVEVFPDNYFAVDQLLEEFSYVQIDRYLDNYIYVKLTKEQGLDSIVKRFKSKPLRKFNEKIAELNKKYRKATVSINSLKERVKVADENYSVIDTERSDLKQQLLLVEADKEGIIKRLNLLEEVYENKNKESVVQLEGLRNHLQKIEELLFVKNKKVDDYLKLILEKENDIKLLEEKNVEMQKSINDKEKHIQDLIRELKNSHENNENLVMQKINLEMEIQQEVINKLHILSREEESLLKLEAEFNKTNNGFMKDIEQLGKEKNKLKNDNNKISADYKDLQMENEQLFKICQKIEFEREYSINNHREFKAEKEQQLLELQKEENHLLQTIRNYESKFKETIEKVKEEGKEKENVLNLLKEYKDKAKKMLKEERIEKETAVNLLKKYEASSKQIAEKEKKERENLLKELKEYKDKYENVSKKYLSLKNSTLGKLTIKYWSMLRKIKR
ncbi:MULTISPECIES: FkbM family methyltransferase [Bacillus cereus group]|uniref:FkbM family methyltransferase n=1 Tax=Bacillus cereus group TaxID=86661 RepID=UPI000BF377D8|nr:MULTISPECIES: FkbM family methyltransferase [Bacillus cereus group]PFO80408.1 FkbM family methyltransferase [Bacillus cereus]